MPARIVLLRRLAPATAPRPVQIAVADLPIFLLEVCTTALLLAVATTFGPLLLAGALLAMLVGRRFCERVRGLAVLGDRRRRAGLATWVGVITALALARTAVALHATGLDAGATDVALTCAAMGALGLLPLGPSAAPAATMVAAGSGADALAAGLVVAAGALVAVAGYALVVLALLVVLRQTAASDGGSTCSSLRRSAVRLARSGSTSSSA